MENPYAPPKELDSATISKNAAENNDGLRVKGMWLSATTTLSGPTVVPSAMHRRQAQN